MLTVYGKKTNIGSVDIYHDKECKQHFATFNNWNSSKPTFRNKYVILNCYRWKLVWIKEVV